MALSTSLIIFEIGIAAQAAYPGSKTLPKVATAVAFSIKSWISVPANVTVNGVTSGTAGVGTVQGKLGFTGPGTLVSAALSAAGVTGPDAPGIGAAVGRGVLASLNKAAQYGGSSFGVGSGTDVAKVVNANSAALIPILAGNLSAVQIRGATTGQLATGLARGISDIVKTGTGGGGVAGLASPVAAAGTSVSVVF